MPMYFLKLRRAVLAKRPWVRASKRIQRSLTHWGEAVRPCSLRHRFILLCSGVLAAIAMTFVLPPTASAGEKSLPVTGLNARTGSVQLVPSKGGGERIRMPYTLYMPDGPGPFPLVVFNHGVSSDPRSQATARPLILASQMVARGYAVVAPMRRGFAQTQGSYQYNACVYHRRIDVDGWGTERDPAMTEEAFDLHAFLGEIVGLSKVDPSRIVLVSQSGGFSPTLGYMTMPRSGVLGYINFVGGGFSYCAGKESASLARQAGAVLGKRVKRPGLWIYARQDSFVSAGIYRVMFDKFVSSGGKASWVLLNPPIDEGHYMLSEAGAVPIWWPHVEAFLRELGLPTDLRFEVVGDARR